MSEICSINFYQGTEKISEKKGIKENQLDYLKQKISDLMNIKNIHFLFGSGVSNGAIPTMAGLVKKVEEALENELNLKEIFEKLNSVETNKNNLENILGVLYSKREYQKGIGEEDAETEKLINLIESTIFKEINIDFSAAASQKVADIYKTFYQKVTYRKKDFSRVNIFTTNNDLFNEKVLDYLNINYNNGFSGGLDKFFNSARFAFTYSKKIEQSIEKYEPLDNMVYLYKLHGSVNWIEEEGNALFNIKEINIDKAYKPDQKNVLIYPNPLKQGKSLTAPYSDIIREFQKNLLLPNSVLFVVGYSFSDDHLNNIIYQALSANTSLSVVIFGNYPNKPIFKIDDKRVYKIFGEKDGKKVHYFEFIVNELMPNLNENKDEEMLKKFIDLLSKQNVQQSNEEQV